MVNYENSLDSCFKKENGIFYTDYGLADRIIRELNINCESTVFDPCCGVGSFLLAAIQNGLKNIYGADIDKNAVDTCLKNINNAKVITTDTIGPSTTETLSKFGLFCGVDYVIGNPPYAQINSKTKLVTDDAYFKSKVLAAGKNLFVAAILKAIKLVKPGGIIAYIIPKNFLHVKTYSSIRKDLIQEKTIVSIIDIGAHFKNVRGEQVVLIIKNEKPLNNSIKIKKLVNSVFINMTSIRQDFFIDDILIFNCDKEISIYKKMKGLYKTIGDICTGYVGRGKSISIDAISGKEIRKFGYKNTPLPKNGNKIFIQNIYSAESGVIAAFGGNLEASQTVTVFTDGDERMCRYLLAILHSRLCNYFLYKFCYNSSSLTMHTDAKYLKMIPLKIADSETFYKILDAVSLIENEGYMTVKWYNHMEELNNLVYKAYGIDEEETQFIDNEMRRVQSKRWQMHGQ